MKRNDNAILTPKIDRTTKAEVFYAGVVLYNPENERHIESIRILLTQDIVVIVFDNSEDIEKKQCNNITIKQKFGDQLRYLKEEQGNIGLSAAFNRIVDVVLQDEFAKGLFLFDQDTDINTASLQRLKESFFLVQANSKLGVIAGYPVRESGVPYRLRPHSIFPSPSPSLVAVHATASSFSLIPVSTLRKVGTFQEDFFIDYIDYDFCIRCWSKDLPVYIDKKAPFTHRVGLGDVVVGTMHLCPIASPFRYYYQVRNIILSGIRSDLSGWSTIKLVLLKYVACFVTSVYAGDGFQRFMYTFRGTIDGITGRSGKLKLH